MADEPTDPVLVQRQRYRHLASVLQRGGGLLYLVASVAFVAGLVTELSGALITVVTVGLIGGSLLLAPGILLAYMVKAAVRDDREKGLSG